MADTVILSLENVSFGFQNRPGLFSQLNFDFLNSHHIGIQGANGSGKTTLLRLMTGLESPSSGVIRFHGQPITDRRVLYQMRCSIGYVLQNSEDQLFSSNVLEEVAFGPLNLGLGQRHARERAFQTLAGLGIDKLSDRPVFQLSGGEKKMVAIASVLSMQPEAVLLDEPTAYLDQASTEQVTDLLASLTIPLLIVSHDAAFLSQTTSSTMTIDQGKLIPATL